MKTLACYNMKGGVGKTTTAVTLAHLGSLNNKKTLIWDLDPQASATFHLGVDQLQNYKIKKIIKDKKTLKNLIKPTPYKNLHIIPAGFEYRNMDALMDEPKKAQKKLLKITDFLSDYYDFFIFDCPPSISNLSESIFNVANYIVMPIVPTTLSCKTFLTVKDHLAKTKATASIIPFFNMVDKRKILHRELMWKHKKMFPEDFCNTYIPHRTTVENMGIKEAPLHTFDSTSDVATRYLALYREVLRKAEI